MKTLFVCPEIRLDSDPSTIPFWAGILAAIVEQKGDQVVLTADANLWREDLRIYEVSDIVVGISAAEQKTD